jgi:predicted DNA-binding transcriptional regulator AlpA
MNKFAQVDQWAGASGMGPAAPDIRGNRMSARIRLLTEQEVAEMLSLSVTTLRSMRSRNRLKEARDPIPFIKIGRIVRYNEDEILQYLDRNTTSPSGEEIPSRLRNRRIRQR